MVQQYFSRKTDELGRVVLPMELRQLADIQVGDSLDICCDDAKNILIRKQQPRCCLCGSAEALHELSGRCICGDCVAKIKAL